MATITLQDVPDSIYDQLQRRAKEHGWTIDREAFNCLASYLNKERNRNQRDVEQLLAEIRKVHEGMKDIYLTEADVEAAINDGRE